MTPLPKRKHSMSRQRTRRAAIKLASPNLTYCPNCSKVKKTHEVCPSCGFYKGKAVLIKKAKKTVKDENRS